MRRRKYLALTSTLGAGIIAGCGSDEGGNGGDESGGQDEPSGEEDSTSKNEDEVEGEATEKEKTQEEKAEEEAEQSEHVDESDGQVLLAYEETASISNGVEVTANGVSLEDSAGGEEPEERDKFAFVEIVAENTSDQERTLPDSTDPDIYCLYGNQQVENTFRYGAFRDSEYEPYEGGDVQGGVKREGSILFEVDEGFEGEIDFLWQDSYFVAAELDGDIDVRWSNK